MDLPLTSVGSQNKNQWQNIARLLKATYADLVILVLIKRSKGTSVQN